MVVDVVVVLDVVDVVVVVLDVDVVVLDVDVVVVVGRPLPGGGAALASISTATIVAAPISNSTMPAVATRVRTPSPRPPQNVGCTRRSYQRRGGPTRTTALVAPAYLALPEFALRITRLAMAMASVSETEGSS
jgi:hypothetical protein